MLLHIDQALIDEISTESGFKLYLAPEWNFEMNVSVTGKIAELPRNNSKNLKIGDEVAFSYRVISDRDFPNTADHFVEVSDGNPMIRVWYNKKGEMLRLMGVWQGAISQIWTATYFDTKGRFQNGCQGTEKEIGRWISQFKFGNADGFVYKNQIHYGDKTYWKCPMVDVFAKKVGDEIEAVGDRVICLPIEIPLDKRIKEFNGIKLPEGDIQVRLYDRAVCISGGEEIGLNKGDIVSFEDKYCERYNLFGKEYFVIRQRRILGVWQNS